MHYCFVSLIVFTAWCSAQQLEWFRGSGADDYFLLGCAIIALFTHIYFACWVRSARRKEESKLPLTRKGLKGEGMELASGDKSDGIRLMSLARIGDKTVEAITQTGEVSSADVANREM